MTILDVTDDWDKAMASLETIDDGLELVFDLMLEEVVESQLLRSDFERIIDIVQLPASKLRDLKALLETRGIVVGEPADDAAVEDDDAEGGWDVDGLSHFINTASHRVLTQREEFELGVKVQAGLRAAAILDAQPELPVEARRDFQRQVRRGDDAAEEFLLHNILLVRSIASKYQRQLGPAMDLDDLVEEGILGLTHAVTKFDPHKGFKFSTYATWWIRQSLQRAIANQNSVIRLPVHAHDQANAIRRMRAEFRHSTGREPSMTEIAERLDLPEATVRLLVMRSQTTASLDRTAGIGTATLGDFVADESSLSPEDWVLDIDRHEVIMRCLGALPTRMSEILISRFGLDGGSPKTLEEIGRELGLTRERVRQIEKKAFNALANGEFGAELREIEGE